MARGWGRPLEDELAQVVPVVSYVVSHGPVDAPTTWVRGRRASFSVFPNRSALDAFVEGAWFAEHVFSLRQVPGLRFDTAHGSGCVTDVWGDTGYRTLSSKRGRAALRVDSPLLPVAELVDELRYLLPAGQEPVIVTSSVGWQATQALPPRRRLRTWTSARAWPDDGPYPALEWVPEPESWNRPGVRAVMKAFMAVNRPEELARSRSALQPVRQEALRNGGLNVSGGIAALERFAHEWR